MAVASQSSAYVFLGPGPGGSAEEEAEEGKVRKIALPDRVFGPVGDVGLACPLGFKSRKQAAELIPPKFKKDI